MPRIYHPTAIAPDSKQIEIADTKYLCNVLRARPGDKFVVFDPTGAQFEVMLKTVGKAQVLAEIVVVLPMIKEPAHGVVLVQAMLKSSKMDLVIQKSTELGVRAIQPVVTERCDVKTTRKLERWKKIALEAARQCGRAQTPELHEPVPYENYISKLQDACGFVFWEDAERGACIRADDVTGCGSDILAVVGPEGGLTGTEVSAAQNAGLVVKGLGANILRAETAAIAAVTLVQHHLGRI